MSEHRMVEHQEWPAVPRAHRAYLVNPAAAKVIEHELEMALTWLAGEPTQTRVELARGRIEMARGVLTRLSQDEYSISDISEAA